MKLLSSVEGILIAIVKLYSMADSFTTTGHIPNLFTEDCWARRQLHNGIRYVPVASKPRKPLHSVEEVFGSILTEFYSIADSSPTAWRIQVLFAGGCWA